MYSNFSLLTNAEVSSIKAMTSFIFFSLKIKQAEALSLALRARTVDFWVDNNRDGVMPARRETAV